MLKKMTEDMTALNAERETLSKEMNALQTKRDELEAKRSNALNDVLQTLSDDECSEIEKTPCIAFSSCIIIPTASWPRLREIALQLPAHHGTVNILDLKLQSLELMALMM